MVEVKQTQIFHKWLSKLKDSKAKAIIAARIFRLSQGLMGDVKNIGSGISELRIHYGQGYRIYFRQEAHRLIILLCAGNKSTQQKDIEQAKLIAKKWSN